MSVTVSGTVLGGLIAGAVGLLSQMLALKYRTARERVNWYRQLEHLTDRLQSDLDPKHRGHREDEVAQSQHEQTAANVIPEIDHHFGIAPVEIPNSIHESQDEMTRAFVKMNQFPSGSRTVGQISIAADLAESIGEWAQEQRKDAERNFYYRPGAAVRRLSPDNS